MSFSTVACRYGTLSLVLLGLAMARAEHGVRVHTGMANASAAVPVGKDLFLAGSDDDNVLKLTIRGLLKVHGSGLVERVVTDTTRSRPNLRAK